MRTEQLAGALLVLCSAVAFSSKAVIVKLAFKSNVDAVTLLALRMIYSAPFFLLIAVVSSKKSSRSLSRREVMATVFCGVVGYYLASLFDFIGLQYIPAALERLILFIYPTFVVLLAAVVYRKPIRQSLVIALGLCYGGILFVFLSDVGLLDRGALTGSLFILGSAAAYALYLVFGGSLMVKIGSMRFTALAMLVSTGCVLVHLGILHPASLFGLSLELHLYSMLMAIVATVLPALLLAAGIRRLGPGPAAVVASAGPVSTILLAWYFLDEQFTIEQSIGTLFVLAGVLVVSLSKKEEQDV
jgi:drug/metabolite transporter (DMT)-like permease